MSHRTLSVVLGHFDHALQQSQNLANAAGQWSSPTYGPRMPRFTRSHQDMLVEMSFLNCFLAWENFLEDSFVLYLLGKKSPRKYVPKRRAIPSSYQIALELIKPERGDFASWDTPSLVIKRAQRFFQEGKPYSVLQDSVNTLQEIQTIRNAIAHRSMYSQERFQTLVRNKLGSYASGMNVGKFLATTKPSITPPISFLEGYFGTIGSLARQIVPT